MLEIQQDSSKKLTPKVFYNKLLKRDMGRIPFFIFVFTCNTLLSQDSLIVNKNISEALELITTDHNKAEKLLLETIDIANKASFLEGEVKAVTHLAGLYMRQLGDFDKADSLLKKGLSKVKEKNYSKGIAELYLAQGISNSMQGNFRIALLKYTASIPLFEKLKDTLNIITCIRNIGYTYSTLKKFDRSKEYLKKAITLAELSHNFQQKVEILSGLVAAKIDNDDLDNVLNLLQEIEVSMPKMNQRLVKKFHLKGRIYLHYAQYYSKANQYHTALEHASKSEKLLKDHPYFYPGLMLVFAEAHNKLGNYNIAEDFCLKGIRLVKQYGIIYLELLLNEEYLKILQAKKGSYKKHYKVAESIISLKDSIYNKQTLKELANITKQYEISQRDKELSDQKNIIQHQEIQLLKERSNNQLITIISFIIIVFLSGGYYLVHQRKHLAEKRLQVLESQAKLSKIQDVMEGEERERQRIAQELHDGINGDLAAIKYDMINYRDSKITPKSVSNYNDIITNIDNSIEQIRTISSNLLPPLLQYSDFIESIKAYCIKISNSAPLNIQFFCYGNFPKILKNHQVLLYRVVQELVNNIVKHAEAKNAIVQIDSTQNELNITVEDDGKGFNPDAKNEGLGLTNVKSRIQLLKGDLDIHSDHNGSTFTIVLDLKVLREPRM